jgi:hypothetical protein
MATPLPPTATPVRSLAPRFPSPSTVREPSTPPVRTAGGQGPTSVLVVTLDPHLVADVRSELVVHCHVNAIATPTDLGIAMTHAGPRPVILLDTSLPSIDIKTFAGLAPILPPGGHVILWGASPRQRDRLATIFPCATHWIASGGAPRAGRFVLELLPPD